jgi:Rap1a immunity proteins
MKAGFRLPRRCGLFFGFIAFLYGAPGESWGQIRQASSFFNGLWLLKTCSSAASLDQIACKFYIAGVSDSSFSFTRQSDTVCLPDWVTTDTVRDITLRYSQRFHPADMERLPAYLFVAWALHDQFPCVGPGH